MKKILFLAFGLLSLVGAKADYNVSGLCNGIYSTALITQDTCNIEASIETPLIENSDGTLDEITNFEEELSAPATIHFKCKSNSSVDYYKWSIIHIKDGNESVVGTSTAKEYIYTFNDEGDYKVKLEAGKLNTDCYFDLGIDSYVKISNSQLDAPNFFSPLSSPGINDEFRVTYKSIIKFKCTIFNRWGNKIYEWNDVNGSWDGKYKGKFVNPGVYFYVIQATGGNNRKIIKKGSINVL